MKAHALTLHLSEYLKYAVVALMKYSLSQLNTFPAQLNIFFEFTLREGVVTKAFGVAFKNSLFFLRLFAVCHHECTMDKESLETTKTVHQQ